MLLVLILRKSESAAIKGVDFRRAHYSSTAICWSPAHGLVGLFIAIFG
jgi:hypothetical protein